MNKRRFSLRYRIFISMTFLIVLMSILVAALSYFKFTREQEEYSKSRLLRKEESTKLHIRIELEEHAKYAIKTENLPRIFKTRIYDVSKVHNLDVAFYDLRGKLLISSVVSFENTPEKLQLPLEVVTQLKRVDPARITGAQDIDDHKELQYSYSYILDSDYNPISNSGHEVVVWDYAISMTQVGTGTTFVNLSLENKF